MTPLATILAAVVFLLRYSTAISAVQFGCVIAVHRPLEYPFGFHDPNLGRCLQVDEHCFD